MIFRFLGDTHGEVDVIRNNINFSPYPTIHVGDVGIGFDDDIDSGILDIYNNCHGYHKFIRGNHDNLTKIKHHYKHHWITDGTYWSDFNVMFVGGAHSIDKHYRKEGINWWRDEQIHTGLMSLILQRYLEIKPDIMVTHDLPYLATSHMFNVDPIKNDTGNLFETMMKFHQPKLWIGGHWHDRMRCKIGNTKFCVVPMNGFMDIEISP